MPHSFFKYLPLKLFAILIRLVTRLTNGFSYKPDRMIHVDTRDRKRKIKVHIYQSKASSKPSPVVLNWHGSAYVVPLHGSDDKYCRHIVNSTKHMVLDASYALAPEYTFPASLEDAEDLLLYVLSKPSTYDVNNIILSGFSAGGTMALVTAANMTSALPANAVRAVVAVYPSTDLAAPEESKRGIDGSKGIIPPSLVRIFKKCYLTPNDNAKDPRVSVIYGDPAMFSNDILIVTAEKDNVGPEAEVFARELQDHGKNVVLKRYNGVDHDWAKSCKEGSREADIRAEAYDMIAKYINALR